MSLKETRNLFLPVLTVLLLTVAGCPMQTRHSMFAPGPGSPISVGRGPSDVVVGDANGDGSPDILTANTGSRDVTVLLGDGKGGFRASPGSPFRAAMAPHLLAAGDLNGDARLDLALAGHDLVDVVVLLGDGQGGFAAAPDSPFAALQGEPHNHGLLLADVNRDAALDIITANQVDDSVSVLLGNGRGGFLPSAGSPFSVGRRPYLPAVCDINRDGNLDLVTPNFGGADVTVLLGNGQGGFSRARGSPYTVQANPYFTTLGDVNGDSAPDLIITHDDSSRITVLVGDGEGGFTRSPGSPVDAGQRGWKVRLGDVDHDGKSDLIMGTADNGVAILLGDGAGGFNRRPTPIATGRNPWGIAVEDLNGDGRLDIVTANSESSDVTVLLSQ